MIKYRPQQLDEKRRTRKMKPRKGSLTSVWGKKAPGKQRTKLGPSATSAGEFRRARKKLGKAAVTTTDAPDVSKAAKRLKHLRHGGAATEPWPKRKSGLHKTKEAAHGAVQKAKFALHQRPKLKKGLKIGAATAATAAVAYGAKKMLDRRKAARKSDS